MCCKSLKVLIVLSLRSNTLKHSQHFSLQAHGICVAPMIPVVIYGWDQSSELVKVCFILGTLGDVGFDIYDAISTSLRTFSKNHPSPTPIEFWFILVCMHHTTALLLVLPLNMFYVHRSEYHQTGKESTTILSLFFCHFDHLLIILHL